MAAVLDVVDKGEIALGTTAQALVGDLGVGALVTAILGDANTCSTDLASVVANAGLSLEPDDLSNALALQVNADVELLRNAGIGTCDATFLNVLIDLDTTILDVVDHRLAVDATNVLLAADVALVRAKIVADLALADALKATVVVGLGGGSAQCGAGSSGGGSSGGTGAGGHLPV